MGYTLKLYRDTTLIYNINTLLNPIADVQSLQSFTCVDTPAAGSYTYYAKITSSSSNPHYVSMRGISLLETKK